MELLALYYKKYKSTVEARDYVNWAQGMLYMECLEIAKLASMTGPLNSFEMESMFERAMKAIGREAPLEDECAAYHLKELHAKLLIPSVDATDIVRELYGCTINEELFEEQMRWHEASELVDLFEYDTTCNMTKEELNEKILNIARDLWHTTRIDLTFTEFIGQKIIGIDLDVHFIIQFEQGALTIECPWRIRNADIILIGETDLQTNRDERKAVKNLLLGTTIMDVQLFEHCPLLIVQCGDLFIDVFHASSYFDGWTLRNEEDFYLFSMHGGQVG